KAPTFVTYGYLDVVFDKPSGADTIDAGSVVDTGAELSIQSGASYQIDTSAVPTQVGDGTFRYRFTGVYDPTKAPTLVASSARYTISGGGFATVTSISGIVATPVNSASYLNA